MNKSITTYDYKWNTKAGRRAPEMLSSNYHVYLKKGVIEFYVKQSNEAHLVYKQNLQSKRSYLFMK